MIQSKYERELSMRINDFLVRKQWTVSKLVNLAKYSNTIRIKKFLKGECGISTKVGERIINVINEYTP